MKEAPPGYNDVRMRVGVFCRPDGFNAMSTGWPFASLSFGSVGCLISASALGPPPVRREFAWIEVVGADRTAGGVRFRFGDRSRTIVVSTLLATARRRLIAGVRHYCGESIFDEQIHPLHWWRWDPDE